MVFGAIVAGGIGSRLNIGSVPKQFMMLGDKPIIIHTIEKFLLCKNIDYVFVGVHKDWTVYMDDILSKYGVNREKIFITEGGKTRNETILNIIDAIENRFGADEGHVIVTHDAVRPFITLRIIEENIESAKKFGACDTVVPAIDTIVESKDENTISSIPDRSVLYQGQTPQSFNMAQLKEIYTSLSEKEKQTLTDACKIFVLRNKKVHLVEGESSNIKITTVGDYKIALAMINGQEIQIT